MTIWQVTPLFRPHLAGQVVDQFSAQTHRDKRLCVVLNGPARDIDVDADLVIRSEPGVLPPLNAAFVALRGETGYLVVRDDDDLFTPGGFDEFEDLLSEHEIVGQKRHWVWDGEYTWMLSYNCWEHYGDHLVWSGNLGMRLELLNELGELSNPPGCDCLQGTLLKLSQNGHRIWHKGPMHACVGRTQTNHAWRATMTTVRQRAFGSSFRVKGYRPDLIAGLGEAEFEIVEKPTVEEAMRSELAS